MWAPGTYLPDRGEGDAVHANIGVEKYFFAAGDRILNRIKEVRNTAILPERTGPIADVLYSAAGNSADEHWYNRDVIAYSFETGADRFGDTALTRPAAAGRDRRPAREPQRVRRRATRSRSSKGTPNEETRASSPSVAEPNPPSPAPNVMLDAAADERARRRRPRCRRRRRRSASASSRRTRPRASSRRSSSRRATTACSSRRSSTRGRRAAGGPDDRPVPRRATPIETTFEFVNEPSVIHYTTDGSAADRGVGGVGLDRPARAGRGVPRRPRRRRSGGARRTSRATSPTAGSGSGSGEPAEPTRRVALSRGAPPAQLVVGGRGRRVAAAASEPPARARGRRAARADARPARVPRARRRPGARVLHATRSSRSCAAATTRARRVAAIADARVEGGPGARRRLPRDHAHGRAHVRARRGRDARDADGAPAAEQRPRLHGRLRARHGDGGRAATSTRRGRARRRASAATRGRATRSTAASTGSGTRSCGSTATSSSRRWSCAARSATRAAPDCAQGAYHDYWFAVVGADDATLPGEVVRDPRALCGAAPAAFVRPCWYRAWIENRPGGVRGRGAGGPRRALRRAARRCSATACITGAAVIGPSDPADQLALCARLRGASDAASCVRGTKVQNLLDRAGRRASSRSSTAARASRRPRARRATAGSARRSRC